MQTDGNFVVYGGKRPLWALNMGANRVNYKAGSFAVLQSDGNFVVKSADGTSLWSSNTTGQGVGPYSLTMQTDGNLVLYDSKKSPIWSTRH
jgi:hypothetical protein